MSPILDVVDPPFVTPSISLRPRQFPEKVPDDSTKVAGQDAAASD